MTNRIVLSITIVFALAAALSAQIVSSLRPAALGLSSASSATAADPSTVITDTDAILIRNRAEVLKGRTSAEGVKYYSVRDSDLHGLTALQELQRLAPPEITASGRVRVVDLVVDISKPLTFVTSSSHPVRVGTVTVRGAGVQNIQVDASISADITVIRK